MSTDLHRHPLAMDPATVRRLLASFPPRGERGQAPGGKQTATGCAVSTAELVDQVAREYLEMPGTSRPSGTINRLARERGVDFDQLLRRIGQLYTPARS